MLTAPGRCPAAYSMAGRTSRTSTDPAATRACNSSRLIGSRLSLSV
ncbi:Uncharacterised protein [Mycobacterium tuberculosis]|nr:Uncharacterised protein [Mycobacterium tuberculosis]